MFDGTNLWTTNSGTDNVTRIDPATGAGTNIALPTGADGPRGIVFDGTNLWNTNYITSSVTQTVP